MRFGGEGCSRQIADCISTFGYYHFIVPVPVLGCCNSIGTGTRGHFFDHSLVLKKGKGQSTISISTATMKRIRLSTGSEIYPPSDAAFSNLSDEDEEHVSARAAYCFGSAQAPMCLARELRKMPTARQEEATKDVLGIPHPTGISPEMIGELWEHINELDEKPAWDLAVQMDRGYAMSPKRAMSFLRSVEGKPKQAAKRLARHFQVKLDLFGSEKLVKDIELSDFDEYDMEALYSGGFQVLPKKDRAGRPILFGRYTLMKYREVKNMVSRRQLSS